MPITPFPLSWILANILYLPWVFFIILPVTNQLNLNVMVNTNKNTLKIQITEAPLKGLTLTLISELASDQIERHDADAVLSDESHTFIGDSGTKWDVERAQVVAVIDDMHHCVVRYARQLRHF